MRWPLVLLLLVLAPACDWPLATGGGTGGTGGGDAGSAAACSASNTVCSDCQSCAVKGPCESLYSSCEADSDCASIDACAGGCNGDATCVQNCYAGNPNGQPAFQAAGKCIFCEQCPCTGLCGSI